ncbi:PxKF domain-containing protein [Microtetraspora fusca]|uniref:PxKF domain-containing protein n=1 Tax=Microtetraspora fusca TaxID=1997 RepID=UPI00082B1E33|nr:PxKF domain-containing protein [Microtetraspora fusca]
MRSSLNHPPLLRRLTIAGGLAAALAFGTVSAAVGGAQAQGASGADVSADVSAATSAPLKDYDREIVDQFDSANSVSHIRHLAVDIGPRLNGTPQEREGAEYIGGILKSYGFDVTLQSWGPVSTKSVAKVTSPNADLPGGPNWQMAASTSAKFTGNDAVVEGQVVYAKTGQSAADFPDDVAGKIVLMDYNATASVRNTAVVNAVSRGAVAVILAYPTGNSAPPSFTLTTAQPNIPVMGGGSAHYTWITDLLAKGPLTLRITTNQYVNPMGTNVIGIRHAVGDPDGTKAPIVMVGAHIDSVLGAPGAHDDASGNGVSLEIARVLSQYPLDKELRIGGFGGEEGGLLGAKAYVNTLTAAEKARFVGEWQMDMVGTPYEPARLWALTPNGQSNFVVQEAYDAAARVGFDGLRNCRLGQSDHQAFYDVGIPSSLFIWLDYRPPAPPAVCGPTGGTYVTEPQYHKPTDTMDNISPERLQITLDVVGGAVAHNALNAVTVSATSDAGQPLAGAPVRADCGNGLRDLGTTGADGRLRTVLPHSTCDFTTTAEGRTATERGVSIAGDRAVKMTVDLTKPTISLTTPADGAVFTLGTAATASYRCDDNLSGVATCTGTVPDGSPLDTSTVGFHAFTVKAADNAGNVADQKATYQVVYPWHASFPETMEGKAGSAVPIKFSLGGDHGTGVIASGYPVSRPVTCATGKATGPAESTSSPGNSKLGYGDGQYNYVWKTDRGWSDTCRQFELKLDDGSSHFTTIRLK